ncbi:MAG: hypothetical protein AAF197_00615 [Pseudomonadota bacterium]
MNLLRTALVMTIPIIGMVMMVSLELLRAISTTEGAELGTPPAAFLIAIVCITTVPVLLLLLAGSNKLAYWIVIAIAGLMALFHALHIVEHMMTSDHSMSLLIAVTMLIPNAVAVFLLWNKRFEP